MQNETASVAKKENQLHALQDARFSYRGEMGRSIAYIKRAQLKDGELWKKFVRQFRRKEDSKDLGWRCEFWGKTMRGACVVYAYDKDEELYQVISDSVEDMLTVQESNGRLSSYEQENEFHGWDVWGRKYVMLGLEYFYDVCRDTKQKERILRSLCGQVDYLISKIGDGEGKIAITDTSTAWGCVNSCSILEAVVWLYEKTNETSYLDFANYLVGTGGCKDGNLLETALKNVLKPHEFPSRKAYEVMSFFNGVLGMYKITGKAEYLRAVKNFTDSIRENDLSIIGGCGCDEEMFDNAALSQTEYKKIMQETCVTVTWIQLCYELLCLTGDSAYVDCLERSAYNALYSSINYTQNTEVFYIPDDVKKIPLPFDSYSPLVNNRRGIVPGGYRLLDDDTYYGCCACIGSFGLGIVPQASVMASENGLVFHLYEEGEFSCSWKGERVGFRVHTAYPKGDSVQIVLETELPKNTEIKLRIPSWSETTSCVCGGEQETATQNGCYSLRRVWKKGDVIELRYESKAKFVFLNGKVAVEKGAIVMARDERFGEKIDDRVKVEEGVMRCKSVPSTAFAANETLELQCDDGKVVHLCDYASAGTDWSNKNNKITVWMNR